MSWLGGWQLFWDWFLLWQTIVENGTSSLCGCFSFKTWDSHVRHVPVDQLKVRGITILLVPGGYAQRKTMWDGSHWNSLNINSNIWTLRPKYPLRTHVDTNQQFQTQSQNDRIFCPQGTRFFFLICQPSRHSKSWECSTRAMSLLPEDAAGGVQIGRSWSRWKSKGWGCSWSETNGV